MAGVAGRGEAETERSRLQAENVVARTLRLGVEEVNVLLFVITFCITSSGFCNALLNGLEKMEV